MALKRAISLYSIRRVKNLGVWVDRGKGEALQIYGHCVSLSLTWRFSLVIYDNHVVLKPRLIDQANGSAYVETQQTKIACAVFVQMSYHIQ